MCSERDSLRAVSLGAVVEAAIGADPGSGLRETSVNLGTLSTGLRRPLLFSSRSNTPVDVAFSSANGGQLRHIDPEEGGTRFELVLPVDIHSQ